MKLNSKGVIVSILILIIMILVCHITNFFYPKNNFKNVGNNNNNNTPKQKDYNEIYYSNNTGEERLCDNVEQAEIPCDIIKKCEPEPVPEPTGLDSLSDSEIAVLYKFAYESAAREIMTRTLEDIEPTIPQVNPWGF